MGGRGARSGLSRNNDKTPTPAQTPSGKTLADVQAMGDAELNGFLKDVEKTELPEEMATSSFTQRFAYALGLNEKPEVLSQQEFDEMAGDTLYRTVNDSEKMTAAEIAQQTVYGDVTVMGLGMYGNGLYFSDNLEGSKLYGRPGESKTIGCKLNSKAKMITYDDFGYISLNRKEDGAFNAFTKTHSKSYATLEKLQYKGRAHGYLDDVTGVVALLKGYNVIKVTSGTNFNNENYYAVFDRGVLSTTGSTIS